MRFKEQRLWDTMKRNAPSDFWLQRIENVAVEGMPDVYVVCAEPCWVELKAPTAPKRPTTRLLGNEGLRPAQINWHLKVASMGVRSFILIRDDAAHLYLIPGPFAQLVNDMTIPELQKISIADTWQKVFEVL